MNSLSFSPTKLPRSWLFIFILVYIVVQGFLKKSVKINS